MSCFLGELSLSGADVLKQNIYQMQALHTLYSTINLQDLSAKQPFAELLLSIKMQMALNQNRLLKN